MISMLCIVQLRRFEHKIKSGVWGDGLTLRASTVLRQDLTSVTSAHDACLMATDLGQSDGFHPPTHRYRPNLKQ